MGESIPSERNGTGLAKKRLLDGVEYMRISDLPQMDADRLREWIFGQTVPVVPSELRDDCVYFWDYERWLAHGRSKTDGSWCFD